MNYLLDTHAFLWFVDNDSQLSTHARLLIEDANNTIYFSVASIWEMAIKVSLNKLTLPTPYEDFIDMQMKVNDFMLLNISTTHTGIVATLPFHHRDPFDRLIIAQSIHEKMPVIGIDTQFDNYGIQREW